MIKTFVAHWDGKALVPDEPVELPAGTRYRVTIEPLMDQAETLTPREDRASDSASGQERSL